MGVYASVVVATHNRRASLVRMLESLRHEAAAVPGIEVIIVVDGDEDGTEECVRGIDLKVPVGVVSQPRSGPAAARNRGVKEASGSIVVFLDDDVRCVPGLLREHLKAHDGRPLVAAFGPMLAPAQRLRPWLEWEAETLEKQYRAMRDGIYAPTPRQFYTANASVARDLFLKVGGFKEDLRRAEDVELAHRLADAGAEFAFLPEAAVLHVPQRSVDDWLRNASEYGQAAVLFERELDRSELSDAYEELEDRHPLNRAMARACVANRFTSAAGMLGLRTVMALPQGLVPRRVHSGACAAAYSIQYWEGVARATGLGRHVWQRTRARG